ncbi:alpha/beta hydrolase [Euzebya tangerina]|uniref:alpha/beta hydrolase n=1 Tax=Euzebya tangerina TaxID=591198 RepID=UPI000E30E0F0|nr:alpha/beta fold hydrolase [Euzebya tangerina]
MPEETSAPTRPTDRQLVLASKLREERTNLRRLAETRGWVGGFRAPHRDLALATDDGETLAASWLPGPAADTAVLLLHGFGAHRAKPSYALLADHLASSVNVLAIDLRGHGGSTGRSTLGAEEWRDVAAGARALRRRGQRTIVAVGLSLGATAICHALGRRVDLDGVVLISGSARHWDLTQPGMRALHGLWSSTVKRWAWERVGRFRMVAPDQITPYPDPVELLAGVTAPTMVIHGEDDEYFSMEHAELLVNGVAGPAELWREPVGFGHAEDGITPAFAARLTQAITRMATTGTT